MRRTHSRTVQLTNGAVTVSGTFDYFHLSERERYMVAQFADLLDVLAARQRARDERVPREPGALEAVQ